MNLTAGLFKLSVFFAIIIFPTNNQRSESVVQNKKRFVLISDGKLNVRDSPKEGKILFQLEKGISVTVVGDETEKWQKIQTKEGKQGFVSTEFLAKHPPSKLEDMAVLGVVSAGKEDESNFRSLSVRIAGKWVSSEEFLTESTYLEKSILTESKPFSVFKFGEKTGEFHPKKRGIGGCQEYPVLNGKFIPIKEHSEERVTHLGIWGKEFGEKIKVEKMSPNLEFSKILEALADNALKNKFPQKKSAIQSDQIFQVKTSQSNYIFIRYSIRSEHEENAYYSALFEFNEGKIGKKMFEISEKLISEQASYGGRFHLMDVFELPGMPEPVFLFFHNGYDGYIYEFYKIRNNVLKKMFLSGGDAC